MGCFAPGFGMPRELIQRSLRCSLPVLPLDQPQPSGGAKGHCTCTQEAVRAERRKTMGSSVAYKTIGTPCVTKYETWGWPGEHTNK